MTVEGNTQQQTFHLWLLDAEMVMGLVGNFLKPGVKGVMLYHGHIWITHKKKDEKRVGWIFGTP